MKSLLKCLKAESIRKAFRSKTVSSYFIQLKKRHCSSQPHDQILLSNLWVCNARIHEADGSEVKLRRLAHSCWHMYHIWSQQIVYMLPQLHEIKQEKLSLDLGNPPVTRVMEAESVPVLIPSYSTKSLFVLFFALCSSNGTPIFYVAN